MAYNKFIKKDGTVMLDLTDTTVSSTTLSKDITAVDKYGNKITGTLTDSPLPIEVSAEEEMTTLLDSGEVGSVYKYTGTTGTYEYGALYEIVEETDSLLGTWVFNDTLTIPDFIDENENQRVYINIEGFVIIPFPYGINNYIELINNIDILLTSLGATNFVNTIEYVSGNNDNFIKASVNYLHFGSHDEGFTIAPIKNELPIDDVGWNFNTPITSGTCSVYVNNSDELLFEYNFDELLYHFIVGGSEIYNSNGNGFYDIPETGTLLNTWTFTGGTDTNNDDFVSWVQANATKSKEFAKLILQSDLEEITITENGEYNGEYSKVTVDTSKEYGFYWNMYDFETITQNISVLMQTSNENVILMDILQYIYFGPIEVYGDFNFIWFEDGSDTIITRGYDVFYIHLNEQGVSIQFDDHNSGAPERVTFSTYSSNDYIPLIPGWQLGGNSGCEPINTSLRCYCPAINAIASTPGKTYYHGSQFPFNQNYYNALEIILGVFGEIEICKPITFTINNISYTAPESMTWREWIYSNYSPSEYSINVNNNIYDKSTGNTIVDNFGNLIFADTVIIPNCTCTTSNIAA